MVLSDLSSTSSERVVSLSRLLSGMSKTLVWCSVFLCLLIPAGVFALSCDNACDNYPTTEDACDACRGFWDNIEEECEQNYYWPTYESYCALPIGNSTVCGDCINVGAYPGYWDGSSCRYYEFQNEVSYCETSSLKCSECAGVWIGSTTSTWSIDFLTESADRSFTNTQGGVLELFLQIPSAVWAVLILSITIGLLYAVKKVFYGD